MSVGLRVDLEVGRGSEFNYSFMIATEDLVYKEITNITRNAPCVLTVPAHGLPTEWPIVISDVPGMVQLNSSEPRGAYANDISTLTLRDVNSTGYHGYTGGGTIRYEKPLDYFDYTGEIVLTALNAPTDSLDAGLILDTVGKRITLNIPAATSAPWAWDQGEYTIAITTEKGIRVQVIYGTIFLSGEIAL